MTKLAEQIKQGADQAWESLSEGWRELSNRASGALTRYWPDRPSSNNPPAPPQNSGLRLNRWAFLAADVFESPEKVIVRIEAPGMQRDDFHVVIHGDVLCVSGEKHVDRDIAQGEWRLVQSAYGNFQRNVTLPAAVQADKTRATYRDGVLRIELPKSEEARPRRIAVQTA